jgi:hypothetical protein
MLPKVMPHTWRAYGDDPMASRLFDKSVVLRELMPKGSQNRGRPPQQRRSKHGCQILGRCCWTSAWAPNGRRHAAGLGRRVDTQSIQNPGRALLALVKRRRVDRFPRGRLPRSLPAARHGLAVTGRLLGQRVNLRFLGALAPMSRVVDGMVRHGPYGGTRVLYADAAGLRLDGFETAAQPYGPEHAYRSSRVRTIETRIDPATPIPFEKYKNILQANSAWPRWFRNWQSSRSRHAGCRNKV